MVGRNYEIMSGDTLVAVWKNNRLDVINEALLPLYLRKIHNADMWLETRAIDSHRANSRLLKKALRLVEKDDVSTVIHVNGATITDNYWIREIGSDLTYNDVRFSDDYFSNLALKGNYDNNMALISRGYPSNPGSKDLLITLFNELMTEHPEYREYIPEITEKTVRKVLDKLNMRVKSQVIVDLVLGRYNAVIK